MASPAITIATRAVAGNRFTRTGTGNLGTYATGGVALAKSLFELPASIKDLDIRNAGGYVFEVSALTDGSATVKAYRQKDPAASGGADIPLPQVGDTVDLSGVTFQFRAEGH